jgi:RHS repeat-associated protein
VTYNGGGLSYVQNFGYDSLNRLTTSNENSGSSWSQTNGYDQYGNRWIDYGGGVHNLSFSTSNNRITTAGFTYDSAGNLLNDGIHAYTYDAEGKIKTVDAATAYVYDGEGHRVRKYVGENTRFIYGIGGQLIAEFDGSTGNLKKEYVYGGATLITIEPTAVNSNGTQYTTTDNLSSPRVITNSSGSVVSRHDYMPFGAELGAGVGGRTTAMGFSNSGDNNRKKFTGYERDMETGLDFAEARYYSNAQGRFTSSDPLMSSGKVADPQSWNRYTYCFNNPIIYSDPNGMEAPKGRDAQFMAGFRGAGAGDIEVLEGTQYTHGTIGLNEADWAEMEAAAQQLQQRQAAQQAQAPAQSDGSRLALLGPPPQMPASIAAVAVAIVPCTPDAPAGIRLDISYEVRDTQNHPMKVAGMTPYETITNATWVKTSPWRDPQTSPGIEHHKPTQLGDATNSNGVFRDSPIGACARLEPGEKFRHNFRQKIFVEYQGHLYPARTQDWIVGSLRNGTGLMTNQRGISQEIH